MNSVIQKYQSQFARDMPVTTLKTLIIGAALFVILLALMIDNPWILAGILAYEVLP